MSENAKTFWWSMTIGEPAHAAAGLRKAGYSCRESGSGIEASKVCTQHRRHFSCSISTCRTERRRGARALAGRSTIRRSRNFPRSCYRPRRRGKRGALSRSGANDFVTKPINLAVLRARIETQLRLRSMRSQLQQQNEELEAWRQNLERDLAAARLTQQSLIPQKPPHLPGWDIAPCTGRSFRSAAISTAGCGWPMGGHFLDRGRDRPRCVGRITHDSGQIAFSSRQRRSTTRRPKSWRR